MTGASGFIGGHVADHLQRLGHRVLPATRDGRNGSRRLDLCNSATMAPALSGVDAVVHCAAGGRRATVDGTRALLRAAAQAGVRRVIHLSSIAVYAHPADKSNTEDSTVLSAGGRGYGAWKAAAEQACLAQPGIEIVRLRPTIVYGSGSQLWVGLFARRIQSGRWGLLGAAGEGTCNLLHVRDLCAAVAAALAGGGAAGAAFNINGPELVSWNGWFSRLAAAIGAPDLRPLPPLTMSARCLAALPAKAMARTGLVAERDWMLSAPARSEIALFRLRANYPVAAAARALGWSPTIGIADGLAECMPWLRAQMAL